jgi:hypothetical protein
MRRRDAIGSTAERTCVRAGRLQSDEIKTAAAARGSDMLRYRRGSVISKDLYELVMDAWLDDCLAGTATDEIHSASA